MEVTNIAIDKLKPSEYNPRLDLQPGDIVILTLEGRKKIMGKEVKNK